jgi:hypothetical protein
MSSVEVAYFTVVKYDSIWYVVVFHGCIHRVCCGSSLIVSYVAFVLCCLGWMDGWVWWL